MKSLLLIALFPFLSQAQSPPDEKKALWTCLKEFRTHFLSCADAACSKTRNFGTASGEPDTAFVTRMTLPSPTAGVSPSRFFIVTEKGVYFADQTPAAGKVGGFLAPQLNFKLRFPTGSEENSQKCFSASLGVFWDTFAKNSKCESEASELTLEKVRSQPYEQSLDPVLTSLRSELIRHAQEAKIYACREKILKNAEAALCPSKLPVRLSSEEDSYKKILSFSTSACSGFLQSEFNEEIVKLNTFKDFLRRSGAPLKSSGTGPQPSGAR